MKEKVNIKTLVKKEKKGTAIRAYHRTSQSRSV